MKKYVIVSGLDVKGLEDKVIAHIEKGYEPCGGFVVTSHKGQEVLSQAMWLIPTINVMSPNFEDGRLSAKEIGEMLARFEEDKLKDGN